jgi:hypothetical protein
MTEQQISAQLDELITMMAASKALETFDKFYHDDLEKTDLDETTHKGKDINRKNGEELLSKVKAVRDFTAVGKIVKGNQNFWSGRSITTMLITDPVKLSKWRFRTGRMARLFVNATWPELFNPNGYCLLIS